MRNFRNFKIKFDMGKPFLPFEQLLAVLPSQSKEHLPEPYRQLMIDVNSPVYDYYPVDFETDLNGKKQDWEAVVLVPFIDEVKLLDAMKPLNLVLTDAEKKRNIHGPMLQYDYSIESTGSFIGHLGLPATPNVYCKETKIYRNELVISEDKLMMELSMPIDSKYHVGFPTLKHLHYTSTMMKSRVKVFDQCSRNDNMIVNIIPNVDNLTPDIREVANDLLESEVFVSWPHLRKAKVIKVSTESMIVSKKETKENVAKMFEIQAKSITEQ